MLWFEKWDPIGKTNKKMMFAELVLLLTVPYINAVVKNNIKKYLNNTSSYRK